MELKARHPFFWFVMIYGCLVAATHIAVAIVLFRYGSISFDRGWEYQCRAEICSITKVNPTGPAAGKLQPGDRIIAINSDRKFGRLGVWSDTLLAIEPYQSYTLRIGRLNSEQEYQLFTTPQRNIHQLISGLILFVAALVSFVCGFWIGLLKPDQKTTRLFTLTWLCGSLIQVLPVMNLMQYEVGPAELKLISWIWFLAISPLPIATGFHFYYRFPPGIPESRFWSGIKVGFYIWTIPLVVFFTGLRVFLLWNQRDGADFIIRHFALLNGLERTISLINIFTMPALFAVVARNYKIVQDPDQRRRLHWVVYGSLLGLLPFVIYSVLDYFYRSNSSFAPTRELHDRIFLIANFALVLIPTTIAFAIVKNRMFEIQFIVRKGVRYLFAKKLLQLFIYLPVLLILIALNEHRDRPPMEVLFGHSSYILVVIAALGGLFFRKDLLEALDRKFFREAYNSERILLNLGEEIKNFNSMPEVAEWVSSQLRSALHPKEILVYYRQREKGDMVLGYSSKPRTETQSVPEGAEWIRILELEGKSQNFASSDHYVLPQNERDWMQAMGIHLLVPMVAPDHRIKGVISLGEKRSEEPYSAADRRLLEAIAGQMAILHDNLLLKEKVDEGYRVQRNVLAHLSAENRNLLKECPQCGTCYEAKNEVCSIDGTGLVLTLPVERTIEGKYRLESRIGKGGMGAVYRAMDLRLNRPIAMKIMMGNMFGDSQALRRFEREARASARLQHPNIITIHDFGRIGDGAFLAMELLEGHTLRDSLVEMGNLSPAVTAKWFDQILEGIKTAHQLGVIHRDLKPENIFISRGQKSKSTLKILDFGLAKVKNVETTKSGTLTAPGTAMGTLHYMSPEQVMAESVDERTDIFSLGVMVIEALTGKLPFQGKSSTDIVLAILGQDYHLEGEEPERKRLDSVIQKCIAKNRENRFSSVAEMQKQLLHAIEAISPFPPPPKNGMDSLATNAL